MRDESAVLPAAATNDTLGQREREVHLTDGVIPAGYSAQNSR